MPLSAKSSLWQLTQLTGIACSSVAALYYGFDVFAAWMTAEDVSRVIGSFSEAYSANSHEFDVLRWEIENASKALGEIIDRCDSFAPAELIPTEDFSWAEHERALEECESVRQQKEADLARIIGGEGAWLLSQQAGKMTSAFRVLKRDTGERAEYVVDNIAGVYNSMLDDHNDTLEKLMNTADSHHYRSVQQFFGAFANMGKIGKCGGPDYDVFRSAYKMFKCNRGSSMKELRAIQALVSKNDANAWPATLAEDVLREAAALQESDRFDILAN